MLNPLNSSPQPNAAVFAGQHSAPADSVGESAHPLAEFPWLFSRLSHSTIFQRQRRVALSKTSRTESNDRLNTPPLLATPAQTTAAQAKLDTNTKALVLVSKVFIAFLHDDAEPRKLGLQQLADADIASESMLACTYAVVNRYLNRCENPDAKIAGLWNAFSTTAAHLKDLYFTAVFSQLGRGDNWKAYAQSAVINLRYSYLVKHIQIVNMFLAALQEKRKLAGK